MEADERDSTQDWLLSEHARPPSLRELEGRIDEALATARSSEAAVMAVGAAALDAAEQARRAAELAERLSTRLVGQPGDVPTSSTFPEPPPSTPSSPGLAFSAPPTSLPFPTASPAPSAFAAAGAQASSVAPEDDALRDFTTRADRVAARLQRLQRLPLTTPR
jgi:hypothetical protein